MGLDVDVNTWMDVKSIKVFPAQGELKWFAWPVKPHINKKQIPARSPLQDFFPFGVYIPIGNCNAVAAREGKALWDWMDEVLADLKKRGMNFTATVNHGVASLDKLAELHQKHGMRFNPIPGQFDVKTYGIDEVLKGLKREVPKYRHTGVIAGWGAGEEFSPLTIPKLAVLHEIVHAMDPQNTLVTIHNKTPDYEVAGKELDIRIAFRDIYPFFRLPYAGPVTFEACMNYYEDEIDKCQRLLPRGASLWVMPQAHGEWCFYTPTVAQIRLQAWSAIAHGAQGLAYFLYNSEGTPEKMAFDGLRALDGSPTDRLEEMTDLAGKLVPLGPVITRWQRSLIPAETDNRSIRAYLFTSPEGKVYAVVYNRNVEQSSKGKVRVPFVLGENVADLVIPKKISVEPKADKSMFPVNFKPGEGSIISLGVNVHEGPR